MDRIKVMQHKGKEILFLDLSNCKPDETLVIIKEFKKVVSGYSEHSLLTITDVSGFVLSTDIIDDLKELIQYDELYVKMGAIVGLSNVQRAVYHTIMMFTNRKMGLFDTIDEAKEYLISF